MLQSLITKLQTTPVEVQFNEVIEAIEATYDYTPTTFTNGIEGDLQTNEAGTNAGSCKIFAFAQLNELSKQQTLQCFGDYYRVDVMQNLDGNDHMNIRNFIQYGWDGIAFEGVALTVK